MKFKNLSIYAFIISTIVCFSNLKVFSQSGRQLTVLNYNTLHGFSGDAAVQHQYINWVKKVNPDIVTYQEMIGYTQSSLQAFAKKYDHNYAVIMNKEAGYNVTHPLAITSKYPIENIKMVLDSMWHGYLYAKVHGIHIFVTHLAPFTLKDRQKDIALIIEQAESLPAKEKILITGDFNSLARVDKAGYGETLLASMKRLEGRLEPKSGTPIVKNRIIYRNNLNNGSIDYSVTDAMAAAGFIDTYYAVNKTFKNSVPVKSRLKKNSVLRRVDYIWVNPALASLLTGADIIQDKVTDVISDHYPVAAVFNLK